MAKKKKNNSNNENNNNNLNTENKNDGEMKKEGGDAEKKDDKGPLNVVLKVEIHCEGCASKIVKYVRGLEGVESVKADTGSNKVTVVGAVDPSKIRDKLERRLKKKVDLVSPQPKKDKEKEKEKENAQKPDNKSKDKPSDDKKPKEPPVTTAVLKLALHCQGCIEKIHRTVQKTKGVLNMKVDKQKELVTVIGTMDPKALAETLKERLRRPVEIVPPKKEAKESNGGDNNEKGGGGKKKKKSGGGGGAEEGVDDGESGGGGGKIEGNRMEYIVGLPGLGYGNPYQLSGYPSQLSGYPSQLSGYPYPFSGYGYGYPVEQVHAPQMFSDENPNAYCSVM